MGGSTEEGEVSEKSQEITNSTTPELCTENSPFNPAFGKGRAHLMSFLGYQRITLGAGSKYYNFAF